MSNAPIADQKVSVMLAGPGHEAVFYQMQPPFLSDSRFVISANATQWTTFEQSLAQMRPDLVVVQVELAPGPEALVQGKRSISARRVSGSVHSAAACKASAVIFEKAAVV